MWSLQIWKIKVGNTNKITPSHSLLSYDYYWYLMFSF